MGLYFIFPCRSGNQLQPTKFESEEELFQHLKAYLGTQKISGGCFSVPVVKDIPSLPVTPTVFVKLSEGKVAPVKTLRSDSAISVVEFNFSERTVSNTVRKQKKIKTLKSKKKIKNIKNTKKILKIKKHKKNNYYVKECFSPAQYFESVLDDIINDVFKKPLRCEKCFITHFPWAKVCKKNFSVQQKQLIYPLQNVTPKLRGGAGKPKYFKVEGENTKKILTILRSLNILTRHGDHDKCLLTTKEELCVLCLVRSLVIRSNSIKGQKDMIPR